MNKKLIFGIIALVAFVVVMLLVFSREKDVYEKPVQDIFAEGMADSLQLKPAELGNLLATGNFLLVDIRKPEYFINESIEGAVNIPAGELLTEENQGRLEEAVESGKRIVLMGANTHETLLPWLLVGRLEWKMFIYCWVDLKVGKISTLIQALPRLPLKSVLQIILQRLRS